MQSIKEKAAVFGKGLAMGIAEVIPGVSGGTIAFITGIYETLIESIKSILGPEVFKSFRQGGLKQAWTRINGPFLALLLSGMATGLIAGVFGVSHLMQHYPQLLWAFFFGLIIASTILVGRAVNKWGVVEIIALIAAGLLAFYITVTAPAQGTEALWFVFVSGAIAISALMLPGVSGSFVLLLLGMYSFVIGSVENLLRNQEWSSLIVVLVFAGGCLIGLATFSRVLSWAFKHYHNTTMAALTGFMIGSLNKLWPWHNVVSTRVNGKGEIVPLIEKNVLPGAYEGQPMIVAVVFLVVAGFLLVWIIDRLGKKNKA